MRRCLFVAAVLALVVTYAPAAAADSAVGDPGPYITFSLTPVAGPPGSSVTVRGTCAVPGRGGAGFRTNPHGSDVIVGYAGSSFDTDQQGRFRAEVTVPNDPRMGRDLLVGVSCPSDGTSRNMSSYQPFTITDHTTAAPPAIFTSPGDQPCGYAFGGGNPVGCEAHVKGFAPDGAMSTLTNFFIPQSPFWDWGASIAAGNADGSSTVELAAGSGPHQQSEARVLTTTGYPLFDRVVFGDFQGGVNVALGDVDGDHFDDLIVAAGPGGGPHVRVYRVRDQAELASFFAYDPSFSGGVFVAAADVDGDGDDEIVTGPGAGGGPHVRTFQGNGSPVGGFFAYAPQFRGGATVAAADFDGDGRAEIVTGAGGGGGPHVRVLTPSGSVVSEFLAYVPAYDGGVYVAAGDVDHRHDNGRYDKEIVTGTINGGPHVRSFNVNGIDPGYSFHAYTVSGSVRVAAVND